MNNVLLKLGSFKFGISTAAYSELKRSTQYRWESQPNIGTRPSHQFVGIGDDTITMPGVIYPEFAGGWGQLDSIRTMAGQGKALSLIDSNGYVWGNWCIVSVSETQKVFNRHGAPRKIEFNIQLKYAGEE